MQGPGAEVPSQTPLGGDARVKQRPRLVTHVGGVQHGHRLVWLWKRITNHAVALSNPPTWLPFEELVIGARQVPPK